MSSESSGMSVDDYAAHRKCSARYVRRLRKDGRLVYTRGGLIDAAATDALLAATSDPLRGGNRMQAAGSDSGALQPDGKESAIEPGSLRHAMQRERAARAGIAELELGELAGDLVRRKLAERATFTLVRQALERMRSMGSRLRTRLAAESDPRECEAILDKEIREISEDMQTAADSMFEQSKADKAAGG